MRVICKSHHSDLIYNKEYDVDHKEIPEEDLNAMYGPFEGEYCVSIDERTDEILVEDSNGMCVCLFNTLTQLPLTDANMKWEKEFWVDRAYQICDALNRDYYRTK